MSDLLVDLSANPWFKQAVKQLGLPIPTPQKLARPAGPRIATSPLARKRPARRAGIVAARDRDWGMRPAPAPVRPSPA